MSSWNLISEKPIRPVQAELFFANAFLRDADGNEVSAIISPGRDERRQIAYWDGETWRHMGTGHPVVEFHDHPHEWMPTHWRRLPELPSPSLSWDLTMGDWQSIEAAPKDGSKILLADYSGLTDYGIKNGMWIASGYWEDSEEPRLADGHWTDGIKWLYSPSHWMPLPEPPATSGAAAFVGGIRIAT